MFESIQRDSRRLGPISTRLSSNTAYDAHAHSPQRSASTHHGAIIQTESAHENNGMSTSRFNPQGDAFGTNEGTYLRGQTPKVCNSGDDPFMGPSSSSAYRWRGKIQSKTTDNTMPDYDANEVGHSRTSTEMSGVSWPRRDFQRHMDEAAIDEIIHALSPEKKGQLMEALSPEGTSSSGLQPPANTPMTADASKGVSPEVETSNDIAIKTNQSSIRLRRRISTSEESSDSSVSGIRRSGSVCKGDARSKILDRVMVTRSQKRLVQDMVKESEEPLSAKRGRTSSESSSRKRSLSPSQDGKAMPKITLRISPDSVSSEKENQQLTDGDSGLEGVSVHIQ